VVLLAKRQYEPRRGKRNGQARHSATPASAAPAGAKPARSSSAPGIEREEFRTEPDHTSTNPPSTGTIAPLKEDAGGDDGADEFLRLPDGPRAFGNKAREACGIAACRLRHRRFDAIEQPSYLRRGPHGAHVSPKRRWRTAMSASHKRAAEIVIDCFTPQ
jgi:hypothetical protein